jgi:hypothetical protein
VVADGHDEVVGPPLEVGHVGDRHAEGVGDDGEGQRDAEGGDEVDLAVGREAVDEVVGEPPDVVLPRLGGAQAEGPVHERALAAVQRGVGVEQHRRAAARGSPADDVQDLGVLLDQRADRLRHLARQHGPGRGPAAEQLGVPVHEDDVLVARDRVGLDLVDPPRRGLLPQPRQDLVRARHGVRVEREQGRVATVGTDAHGPPPRRPTAIKLEGQ